MRCSLNEQIVNISSLADRVLKNKEGVACGRYPVSAPCSLLTLKEPYTPRHTVLIKLIYSDKLHSRVSI